jgi:hypothetical protein
MKDQIKFALDLKQHFERDDKSQNLHWVVMVHILKKEIRIKYSISLQSIYRTLLFRCYTRIDFDDDLSDIEIFKLMKLKKTIVTKLTPIGEEKLQSCLKSYNISNKRF